MIFRLLLALFLSVSPALAEKVEVDVELVLAMDISGSMHEPDFDLQVEAMAAAFESDEFASVLDKLMTGKIAVVYYQWATHSEEYYSEWHLIDSRETARAFAAKLRSTPRAGEGWETNHERMFEKSLEIFQSSPFEGLREVLDVSGDGHRTVWHITHLLDNMLEARDALLARGVVINGLPIGNIEDNGMALDEWYRTYVIGGPGAFLEPAVDFQSFAFAFRRKLIIEVAGWVGMSQSLEDSDQSLPHVSR